MSENNHELYDMQERKVRHHSHGIYIVKRRKVYIK